MEFLTWEDASSSGKKVIALFMHSSWCVKCDSQLKEMEGLDLEFPQIAFTKEDADERPDLAIRYTPQIYPSISLITETSVMGGTYGLVDREKLREILGNAVNLAEGKGVLRSPPRLEHHKVKLEPEAAIREALRSCEGYFDWTEGGFEAEPKFVSPEALRLFLRFDDIYHKAMVTLTLDKAIENLWGDGFYLYSETVDWKAPYPAKLFDFNSEMVVLLLEAYRKLREDTYLDYGLRALRWMTKNRRRDGLFPNAEVQGKLDLRAFLNVNASVGEALLTAYQVTDDKEYLEVAEELFEKLGLYHNLDKGTPPFLIDVARYLKLASLLKREEAVKRSLEFLKLFKSGEGSYYDVTLEYAKRQKIGRYAFLYDNSVLAQAYILLGMKEEARKILESIAGAFPAYTYFNQAIYALALGDAYDVLSD